MADRYALEFVGGPDGTSYPPKKLDGRVVGAKDRRVRARKPVLADGIGDRVFVGRLPQSSNMRGFSVNTDTSLGGTTLSVGTTAIPAKYVVAKTVTTTDQLVSIGPKASALALDPVPADEDIWVTFGGAAVPAGAIVVFDWIYTDAN